MLGDCANCNCNHMCAKLGKSCTGVQPEEVLALYNEDERRIMDAAAYVEATYYMKYTRLQETAAFARKMGYTKIGIGFCIGIAEEARLFAAYLSKELWNACVIQKARLIFSISRTANYLYRPVSALVMTRFLPGLAKVLSRHW